MDAERTRRTDPEPAPVHTPRRRHTEPGADGRRHERKCLRVGYRAIGVLVLFACVGALYALLTQHTSDGAHGLGRAAARKALRPPRAQASLIGIGASETLEEQSTTEGQPSSPSWRVKVHGFRIAEQSELVALGAIEDGAAPCQATAKTYHDGVWTLMGACVPRPGSVADVTQGSVCHIAEISWPEADTQLPGLAVFEARDQAESVHGMVVDGRGAPVAGVRFVAGSSLRTVRDGQRDDALRQLALGHGPFGQFVSDDYGRFELAGWGDGEFWARSADPQWKLVDWTADSEGLRIDLNSVQPDTGEAKLRVALRCVVALRILQRDGTVPPAVRAARITPVDTVMPAAAYHSKPFQRFTVPSHGKLPDGVRVLREVFLDDCSAGCEETWPAGAVEVIVPGFRREVVDVVWSPLSPLVATELTLVPDEHQPARARMRTVEQVQDVLEGAVLHARLTSLETGEQFTTGFRIGHDLQMLESIAPISKGRYRAEAAAMLDSVTLTVPEPDGAPVPSVALGPMGVLRARVRLPAGFRVSDYGFALENGDAALGARTLSAKTIRGVDVLFSRRAEDAWIFAIDMRSGGETAVSFTAGAEGLVPASATGVVAEGGVTELALNLVRPTPAPAR